MTLHDWSPFVAPILSMLAAGLAAGFLAGLFGIGGGFIVVPALAMLLSLFPSGAAGTGGDDHYMHVAIGTSLGTIVITSLRSVHAHARRGAVDFSILRRWAPWLTVGVCIGIALASHLQGRSLRLVFGFGVFIVGLHFIFPVLGKKGPVRQEVPTGLLRASLASFLGGYSALLGIGGGAPAVLILTLSGVPIHRAVATAAGFGTIIAVPGMIGNVLIGWNREHLPIGSLGFVNVPGLLAITAASMLTAPLGVACAHSLNEGRLKRVFGVYLLFTSSMMFYGYARDKSDSDVRRADTAWHDTQSATREAPRGGGINE